ncbi:hypothetical protein AMJ50_00230 [Parcubacteria bacterium DG_74_3]|nr:MAG: hypothetical protein AMJ50_00230 [Parcubacteria bacterium DG_74_3]
MIDVNKIKKIRETYGLIRKLSAINGPNVNEALLDRVIYNSETLPPLGKEYWWFLFFGQGEEKPAQVMLMIFRKHGKKMLFNDKEIILRNLGKNKFQAVTTGWVYDGKRLHDLGDTNAITEIQAKSIFSEISGQEMTFSGSFPNYRLKIDDAINLNIRKTKHFHNKEAFGAFMPPFGAGCVNIYSEVDGVVLGKRFRGTGHLQKVVGVTMLGPWHWGRVLFQNSAMVRFFCIKIGENSRKYFHSSLDFYDYKNGEIIKFNNPRLKISKRKGDTLLWIVEGRDNDKDFKIVLETYTRKQFIARGGGSLVYNEYAVIPKELNLKSKGRLITLDDVGNGVGTFEDVYW